MVLTPQGRLALLLIGSIVSLSGIYTIRSPKNRLTRLARRSSVDRRLVVRHANDPLRVQQVERAGWFSLVVGIVTITGGLAATLTMLQRVGGALFLLALAYFFVVRSIREYTHAVATLLLLTAIGLLVAVLGGAFELLVLATVGGGLALGYQLVGSPLSYGQTYAKQTFHYRCLDCEHEFETDVVDMAAATCPECGSTRVTTIVPE